MHPPLRKIRVAQSAYAAEQGYLLLGLLFITALLLIALAIAAPEIGKEIQRQKEAETIHRGNEYKRAIKLYYKKFGRYPASIDQLKETNKIRFLRQDYVDPMTGKKDWKFLHLGQVQMVAMGFFGKPLQMGGVLPGGSAVPGMPGSGLPGSSGVGGVGNSSGIGGSSIGGGSSFGSNSSSGFGSSTGGLGGNSSSFGSSMGSSFGSNNNSSNDNFFNDSSSSATNSANSSTANDGSNASDNPDANPENPEVLAMVGGGPSAASSPDHPKARGGNALALKSDNPDGSGDSSSDSFSDSSSSFGNDNSSFGNSGSSFGNSQLGGSSNGFGNASSGIGNNSGIGGSGMGMNSTGMGGGLNSNSGTMGSSGVPGLGGTLASNMPGATTGGSAMGAPIIGVTVPLKNKSILSYRMKTVYNQWYFIYNPQEEAAQAQQAAQISGSQLNPGANGSGLTPSSGMPGSPSQSGLGSTNSSGFGSSSGSPFGSGSGLGSSSSGFGSSGSNSSGFGGGFGSSSTNGSSGP